MTKGEARQFAFVPIDPVGRPQQGQRQLIRSHCMQGKNKRAGSRRSTREANKRSEGFPLLHHPSAPPPPINDPEEDDDESDAVRQTSVVVPELDCAALAKPTAPRPTLAGEDLRRYSFADLSTLPLAFDVGHSSQRCLSDFLTYSAMKTSVHPIEQCVAFDYDPYAYITWLFIDKAFLHSVLLSTSAMHDFRLRRPLSRATLFHLDRSLACLNAKLTDTEGYLTESTTWIIQTLATLAVLFGDRAAAAAHMAGLKRIIGLLGGQQWLRGHMKKYYKLDRLDLVLAASSGGKPYFSNVPTDWSSIFARPANVHSWRLGEFMADGSFDCRLATIFCDLQDLTATVNHHMAEETKLSGDQLQSWLGSIQARLLWLPGTLAPDSECLRLGMLAFLTTTFRVPGAAVSYPHLSTQLRRRYLRFQITDQPTATLKLWLLMMGVMSVWESGQPWLQFAASELSLPETCWEEARPSLETVIWIDYIHDEPGRRAFTALRKRAYPDELR